jgi:hypothetical protein
MRIHKYRHSLRDGLLKKSQLAQHAYEESHRVSWNEARILETESNSRHRKYNKLAHMTCSTKPFSQPSLEISPTWIPLMSKEVIKSKI